MSIEPEVVNLSPHPVHLLDEDNEVRKTWPRCEDPPRVEEVRRPSGVNFYFPEAGLRVPVVEKDYGDVNLPPEKDGRYFIVSAIVARACPGRNDLLIPNTIRDEEGQILGCVDFSVTPRT